MLQHLLFQGGKDQNDIDSFTLTNCCSISYKNEVWISFPTEKKTLISDPNTFRQDGEGKGVLSFYKFTNYDSHKFLFLSEDQDNEYLLAFLDTDPPRIDRCDNGVADGSTAIPMVAMTKFYDFTGFQYHKFMGRLKPKIKEVASTAGEEHTLNFYAEDGIKSATKNFNVSVGSGYYSTDISLPYNMDGKNISIEFSHNGLIAAGLIGYAIELVNRRF